MPQFRSGYGQADDAGMDTPTLWAQVVPLIWQPWLLAGERPGAGVDAYAAAVGGYGISPSPREHGSRVEDIRLLLVLALLRRKVTVPRLHRTPIGSKK
jgi:hypothetical protein